MPKSAERCRKIREQTREMILQKSMLYFARHGFAGTKISELAKFIGIGQGTIYTYFKSKEDLFQAIFKRINRDKDIEQLKFLSALPIPAENKIHRLTDTVLQKLENDENFAAVIALNTPLMIEQDTNFSMNETTYQSELYAYTTKIIEQGQKEGSVVDGVPLKLTDYYWGVVYLYSIRKLFTTQYEMITHADLERTVLNSRPV